MGATQACRRILLVTLALLGVVIGVALRPSWIPEARGQASVTGAAGEIATPEGGSVTVTQVSAAELAAAAAVPQPSIEELEALFELKLRRREGAVNGVRNGAPAPPDASSAAPGPETEVQAPEDESGLFHGTPSAFAIGRNILNNNANNATLASTLAEPAAANNGSHVFAAGNFRHAEKTLNGASPFSNIPLPGGPSDAPILCCDHDVVIDDARRVLFHSALYFNSTATDGVVRIFVWRTINQATFNCAYDVRVTNPGPDTTVLPDFPHLGLTKKHLFLSINGVGSSLNIVRYMIRLQLDQLVDCLSASSLVVQSFSQFAGSINTQRAWVPAQGTNNHVAMFWGQLDPNCGRLPSSCTVLQIFRWLDTLASPTSFNRTITGTRHNILPDCRGGTGNFNFVTGIATDARGFNMRSAVAPGALSDGRDAVGFWWNAAPTGGILQGHVRAAVFDSVFIGLLAQPHIFNNSFCFAYPNVTSNKRGDFGLHVAFGGRAGGGGIAASTAVGVDDEFTAGLGQFTLVGVLSGTHNRSDGRYGDYHTVRPHEPCEKWFSATTYVLRFGTSVSNVVSRYLEFGRNVNTRCWRNNAFQQPTP